MKTLALLISDYLVAAEQQKKLSLHTIKAYRIDLHQFAEFTQGNLADTDNSFHKFIHGQSISIIHNNNLHHIWNTQII